MCNRFHNKFHRHNHHTTPTDRSGKYPDSAYDPIASLDYPFQGDFYVNGNINTSGLIQPTTTSILPQSTVNLPRCNDVEFDGQTSAVTIANFTGGVRGVTYTLTNKGAYNITINSTNSIKARDYNTTNSITLSSKYSCSLRADSSTDVSVW